MHAVASTNAHVSESLPIELRTAKIILILLHTIVLLHHHSCMSCAVGLGNIALPQLQTTVLSRVLPRSVYWLTLRVHPGHKILRYVSKQANTQIILDYCLSTVQYSLVATNLVYSQLTRSDYRK